MQIPDMINGAFETCGGGFVLLSILKLHRAKVAEGVSYLHVGFFTAWGFWNLYLYPHLGMWLSSLGQLTLVTANTYWLGQIVWYNHLKVKWLHLKAGWRCDENVIW